MLAQDGAACAALCVSVVTVMQFLWSSTNCLVPHQQENKPVRYTICCTLPHGIHNLFLACRPWGPCCWLHGCSRCCYIGLKWNSCKSCICARTSESWMMDWRIAVFHFESKIIPFAPCPFFCWWLSVCLIIFVAFYLDRVSVKASQLSNLTMVQSEFAQRNLCVAFMVPTCQQHLRG